MREDSGGVGEDVGLAVTLSRPLPFPVVVVKVSFCFLLSVRDPLASDERPHSRKVRLLPNPIPSPSLPLRPCRLLQKRVPNRALGEAQEQV